MAELPKNYDPKTVEPEWYQRWLKADAFRADAKSTKAAFSIVIPPPNVTGVLTLGHVLNNTIQDILCRRARMRGCEVLWLPGMDHAGIGTQTAVEKWLRKNEGVTRHDLGREEFLRRVVQWQDKHGGIIIEQLKRLGCSCDWSRQRYTFDEPYVRAVENIFVDLYNKGLIYKGRRMINWDPVALTALSDEEVISTPTKSALFHVRYKFTDNTKQFLEVATTRPETIMADVALAVHPDDERYRNFIGQKVWRPLANEAIPIIADEAIDPKFGTGILKVTPAHDKVDFEIGARHKLPVVDVLTDDARINCPGEPELHGLERFAAREKAAEILRERGLLSKTEPHESNVGFSERAGVPIEPRLSEQWFLHYPKTEEALRVVQRGAIVQKNIAVVSATGNEIQAPTIKELRRKAIAYARQHNFLGPAFINEDSKLAIRVGRASLSHIFSNRGAVNIKAIAVLPELIRTAIWISSELHDPPNPLVKQVHHFVAALRLGDVLYRIQIIAKEFYDGTIYYHHKAKKRARGGKSLEAHLPREKLDTQPAPNANWTVADLLDGVNQASIRFFPAHWEKVYAQWLENIQDWCISRQVWWGHRIPAWYWSDDAWHNLNAQVVVGDPSQITGRNIRELRASAWRYAREKGILGQNFLNLHTGFRITVQRSSLEHAFSNLGTANVKLVPSLPLLLRHAIRICAIPHQPYSPDVRRVHVLFGAFELGHRFYRIKFTVKELIDGKKLYDHQSLEIKSNEPDGKKSPEAHSREGKLASRPTSGSRLIKFDELMRGVNRDAFLRRVQIESPGEGWVQDPDTLDTWFSSWLWAYETMDPVTRARFYPTSVLVTAADIIFFWVARMIIAGLEFKPGQSKRDEDNIPFRDVFFTGIIRDNKGRKMSKSLGNSPDPLDLMAKYGADGLRFGLMRTAPSGQDIRYDEKQIEEGRNFATKLWNVARFRQMHGPPERESRLNPADLSIYAIEVLARLNETIAAVEESYADYHFNTVAQKLYDFVWGDFCDWFVEAAKTDIFSDDPRQKKSALTAMDHVLSAILHLLHPFMPHVTDELWSRLGFARGENNFLDFSSPPEPVDLGDQSLVQTARWHARLIYEMVEAGRNLRAEARIARKSRFALRSASPWIREETATIARLLNAEALEVDASFQPPSGSSVAATKLGELFLLREGEDRAGERDRLDKEIAKLEGDLRATETKLGNASFIERAPAAVVEEHRRRRDDFEKRLRQLRAARAPLD